jgi:hypothetical protein
MHNNATHNKVYLAAIVDVLSRVSAANVAGQLARTRFRFPVAGFRYRLPVKLEVVAEVERLQEVGDLLRAVFLIGPFGYREQCD